MNMQMGLKRNPATTWGAIAVIAIALLVLPFLAAAFMRRMVLLLMLLSALPSTADQLALVSSLSNSTGIADGEEVAEIVIGCESGTTEKLSLLAGRDVSEWAFDRADVRPLIKPSRAFVAESWDGDGQRGFQAHSYLARLKLPAASAQWDSLNGL